MTITRDASGDVFDFDAFPETGIIAAITSDGSHTNDWDEGATLPTADIATNPLTATFSDLDLAPAREFLMTPEFDADYWLD